MVCEGGLFSGGDKNHCHFISTPQHNGTVESAAKFVMFLFPVITSVTQVAYNLIVRGSEMSVRDVLLSHGGRWTLLRCVEGLLSGGNQGKKAI